MRNCVDCPSCARVAVLRMLPGIVWKGMNGVAHACACGWVGDILFYDEPGGSIPKRYGPFYDAWLMANRAPKRQAARA